MSDMQPYRNLRRHSGVESFSIDEQQIVVRFRSGTHREYGYSLQSVGEHRLSEMKRLARQGHGLNSYINREAEERYAWRR